MKDALKEIINIGVGHAAGMLNDLLNHHIILELPQVDIINYSDLDHEFSDLSSTDVSAVRLQFKGALRGVSSLVFPPDSASKLADLLMGEEFLSDDLDEIKIGTLSEVGNIVLNSVMGSFSNTFETLLQYSIPAYYEGSMNSMLQLDTEQDTPVISAKTRFTVESHEIEGEILLFFELGSFDFLKEAIDTVMEA